MLEFRVAMSSDMANLAPRLRAGDAAECIAAGFSPLEALEISVGNSHEAWAVQKGDRVIAMWGYTANGLFGDAEVWLLTSPEVEAHKLTFVRENNLFLAHVLEYHGSATCYVHAEYTRAIRWLAWLGFQTAGKVSINGAEFIEMRIRRH